MHTLVRLASGVCLLSAEVVPATPPEPREHGLARHACRDPWDPQRGLSPEDPGPLQRGCKVGILALGFLCMGGDCAPMSGWVSPPTGVCPLQGTHRSDGDGVGRTAEPDLFPGPRRTSLLAASQSPPATSWLLCSSRCEIWKQKEQLSGLEHGFLSPQGSLPPRFKGAAVLPGLGRRAPHHSHLGTGQRVALCPQGLCCLLLWLIVQMKDQGQRNSTPSSCCVWKGASGGPFLSLRQLCLVGDREAIPVLSCLGIH